MEFRAQVRFIRVSPQKARLVLDLIKGQQGGRCAQYAGLHQEAGGGDGREAAALGAGERQLSEQRKGHRRRLDKLYVKDAIANDGPRMKRIRPAPMGRAFRYVRRIAHIEIVLAERGVRAAKRLATVVGEETRREGGGEEGSGQGKAAKKAAKRRKRRRQRRRQRRQSRSEIMGQKVHPYGFRLGYTKPWKSRWFVERDYDKLLLEDVKLKQ